ncbi:MAG: hypothetical protein RIB98_17395 [Acidimicrobiales bacterium]
MTESLPSWSIHAVNLAEHADNPVHTHAGGVAAGYPGAVVAGTTIYGYLTRPAVQAWGLDWIGGGSGEVRFRAPVVADELVEIGAAAHESGWEIEARTSSGRCATLVVGRGGELPSEAVGERLDPLVVELTDRWTGYATRSGEDLGLCTDLDIVHPVVWPALANRVFSTQLVDGPWVHTRSRIRHLGTATPGDTAVVEAWLVGRLDSRAGERAVVDVRISIDHRPVAAIEHEAIVRLAPRTAA